MKTWTDYTSTKTPGKVETVIKNKSKDFDMKKAKLIVLLKQANKYQCWKGKIEIWI